MLAATAGLLHALGKFGSGWKWRPLPGWRPTWPDFFRTAVLASRVPAFLATTIDLAYVAMTWEPGTPWSAMLTPLTLLVLRSSGPRPTSCCFAAPRSQPSTGSNGSRHSRSRLKKPERNPLGLPRDQAPRHRRPRDQTHRRGSAASPERTRLGRESLISGKILGTFAVSADGQRPSPAISSRLQELS